MSKIIKKALCCFLFVINVAVGSSNAQTLLDYMDYGNMSFEQQNYITAIYYYKKLLLFNMDMDVVNPEQVYQSIAGNTEIKLQYYADYGLKRSQYYQVIHHLANSYRLSYNYRRAQKWFAILLALNLDQYPLTRYWYALSLKKNGKYKGALKEFVKFVGEYSEVDSYYYKNAQMEIKSCAFAIDDIINSLSEIVIEKIGDNVNSVGADFGTAMLENDSSLIFTTSRPGCTEHEHKKKDVNWYFTDLYTTHKTDSGWTNPVNIGLPINSENHEGAPALNEEKNKMYFTRWYGTKTEGEFAIYVSNKLNEQWLPPAKLNETLNMPGFRSMQPCLSPNSKMLYFASDRPGGVGKLDLWFVELDDNGLPAGEVTNLGPRINTPEDDVSPFYHNKTDALYFSTDGRLGFGGLDIFKAYGQKDNWSEPMNMGFLFNSSRDDVYFTVSKDENSGYISSDREGCSDDDGSCYKIFHFRYTPPIFFVQGKIYDKKTKRLVTNALVTMEDNIGNTQALVTDESGSYFLELRSNSTYYIKGKKLTYFSEDAIVTTVGLTESSTQNKDFYLERIPIGEIEIPGILYEYDKWGLLPESKLILNDLVKFLKLNDNIIIQVASHTDERGGDKYNLTLSKKRAKSVIDFLFTNGVENERLRSLGFGESKLLILSAQTEEEHHKNRRTTFRILSEDYIPESRKKL